MKLKMRLTRSKIFALALLATLPAAITQAADIRWNGATDSYTNAVNWIGGVVPSTNDTPINDNGLANVVQINAGDPDWTINDLMAGGTENALGAFEQNGQTVNVTGWFHLGALTNSTGSYTLNNGTLNIPNGRLFMGEGVGSTSTLTINGGTLNKSGDVFVIADGGWNGSGARIGTVNQNGGTVNSSSEIWIGQVALATGIYNLHAGGAINSTNWFVVGRAGSVGTMNMDGGSILQVSGGQPAFIVADGATGTLNHSGGTITTTAGEFWIGNGGAALGTNNMSGTAVLNVNNWIAIGRGGVGVLNLSGGAITKTGGGNIVIGAPGTGIINQTGGAFTNITSQTWVGETGTGTWNLNDGAAMLGVVQICHEGTAVGTVNLNGGVFGATEITTGNAVAFSTLNLNGGTILARGNNVNFIHGLIQALVAPGGAIFDSQNFNVTVAQPLFDDGSGVGGLTKNGSGTLTLTGANAYYGPTLVNQGKLITVSGSTASGDYTVADNAGFGLILDYGNAQFNVANMSLGSATGASLDFNLGAFGNPSVAPLNVAGTFTANGTITVNIADGLPQVGQFPLVHYATLSGVGNFVVGTIPVGVVANVVTNELNNTIDLNISSVNLPRWEGSAGGDWDIGVTENWINIGTGLPTTYGEGNFVVFDDNATGTPVVNLVTTVNPGSVTAKNSVVNYTLTGPGKISGPIGFNKQGSATFTIANTGGNNFTGPTVVSGGVLSVTSLVDGGLPSSIGASSANPTNLVLAGGVLSYTGPDSASMNRGVSLLVTNSTFDVQSNLTFSGSISPANGSGFVKTGPAQLKYAASGSNTLSGGFNPGFQVNAGTMFFDGSNGGQTNINHQDLWVGGTPLNGASLILSNTVLSIDTWFAAGRGNGTVGNTSSVSLYNSTLSANGISFGFANGIAGNLAFQTLALNGTSTLTNRGGNVVNIAESGGSTTAVTINDNSTFGSSARLVVAGGGATGSVAIANSGRLYINAYMSLANGNGAKASMLVKDSGSVFVATDFNVSDTGSSTASLTLQDNAVASGNSVYVGKANTSVGTLNISGGTLTARGGNHLHIAQNGGSSGNVNLSGGTVAIGGELWMGESGNGVWNQTAGSVYSTNWVAIGRNTGSTGTFTISGGSLNELDPADRLIVGSSGTGTLTLSGLAQVMSRGTFQIGENASGKGTVNLNGGTLTVPQITRGSGVANFNFNGGTLVAGNSPVTVFMTGLTSATIKGGGAIVDTAANTINIGQPLLDGGEGGGLTKIGSGTLRLNGISTYTGATLISAGKLSGTGTLASPVTIAPGATLAPGTTIGTLTINKSLTLSAGSTTSIEISPDGGTNSSDLVTGLTNVNYAGTLVVTNIGTNALAAGQVYKLFNAASASGNFSSVTILPAGTGSFNPATGELTISSSGVLTVNPPTVSNGNLIFAGTGGTPNGSYSILTSTNVAAPVSTWTTNTIGTFDGSGAFSNGIPVSAEEPTRFFLLRTP